MTLYLLRCNVCSLNEQTNFVNLQSRHWSIFKHVTLQWANVPYEKLLSICYVRRQIGRGPLQKL